MNKKILLSGLCSTHWGRVENGNIGNYYIVETAVRELHRVFPNAQISTTFQMTKDFCNKENIFKILPLDLYYNWSSHDVERALLDYAVASIYSKTGNLIISTPWIQEIMKQDLVIDFSGEMWGDHAEPVGTNRFLVNLLKMRSAQLMGKKTILLAGSQGPFTDPKTLDLAREVFGNYTLVSNREAMSKELLDRFKFNIDKVHNFACPAFLFEPLKREKIRKIIKRDQLFDVNENKVGFILCGFNMLIGPYNKTMRKDIEFVEFAKLVEHIINELKCKVILMSHQNGFEIIDGNIILKNGIDYHIIKQLYEVVEKRSHIDMTKLVLVEKPYNPWETKGIINECDIFLSGRVHGLVASLSQNVPSVLINRGHGGASHRNIGFAKSAGIEDFISDPSSAEHMINTTTKCWEDRINIREKLKSQMKITKKAAQQGFDILVNQ